MESSVDVQTGLMTKINFVGKYLDVMLSWHCFRCYVVLALF